MLFSVNPNICSIRALVFDFFISYNLYSKWSFERLYKLGIVNVLNIITLSKDGLLLFENSFSSSINA